MDDRPPSDPDEDVEPQADAPGDAAPDAEPAPEKEPPSSSGAAPAPEHEPVSATPSRPAPATRPRPERGPAPEPPGPPPARSATILFTVFLGLCLLCGFASLVTGPHVPDKDTKQDEVEILDGDPFSSLGVTPEGVALVHVYGAISFASEYFGNDQAADWTIRTLKKLKKVDPVKAVVLRVNSPGGTVASSEAIHREILELKKAGKAVVVSMADMAASGGYYISAPADYIFANGGTITGSIGVITQLPRFKGLADKVGVSYLNITSGKYKDMGNPFRDLDEAEVDLFRTTIMNAYLQFVDVVADGRARAVHAALERDRDDSGWRERIARMEAGEDDRPLPEDAPPEEEAKKPEDGEEKPGEDGDDDEAAAAPSKKTTAAEPELPEIDVARVRQRVRELADGRIYVGSEAVRLGLVDAIGGLQDAVDKAGELAGLGKNPKILKPKGKTELQRFMKLMGSDAGGGRLAGVLSWIGAALGLDPAPEATPYAPVRPMPVAYLYGPGS